MWSIGWAPNSISIYIQQDATLHSLFITGKCSTCFGWYFHPSSGAHTPVSTAPGICHTVTAICRYQLEPCSHKQCSHKRRRSLFCVRWISSRITRDKYVKCSFRICARMLAWPCLSFCLHAINHELINGFLLNLVLTASRKRSNVLHLVMCYT
jgi:hypothetical protein